MGLQSEPVVFETSEGKRKKAETLRRHGATDQEIAFLMGSELSARGKRVELNAMTSPQFISFLEKKLEEHEVEKIIPDNEVMIEHARRVLGQKLAEKELDAIRERIEKQVAESEFPDDLRARIEHEIQLDPSLPWDLAVAKVVDELDEEEDADGDTSTEETPS